MAAGVAMNADMPTAVMAILVVWPNAAPHWDKQGHRLALRFERKLVE